MDKWLHQIMSDIHEQCVTHGKNGDYINYVKGANIAGFMKVANAMMAQGVVCKPKPADNRPLTRRQTAIAKIIRPIALRGPYGASLSPPCLLRRYNEGDRPNSIIISP